MRLTDYLELVGRRKALVVLIVVGTTLAALALAYFRPPEYEASARIRVRPVAAPSELGTFLQERLGFQTSVQTEGELVRSAPVAEAVLERFEGLREEPAKLLRNLEVFPLPNTEVLIIRVTRTDAALARDLANAFVDAYIGIRRSQAAEEAEAALVYVTEQVRASEAELDAIEAQLSRVPVEDGGFPAIQAQRDSALAQLSLRRAQQQVLLERSALTRGVADVIEHASLPPEAGQDLPRNGVLGFLIGIPLALGAVLLLDSSDTTLKSRADTETHTDSDVLGVVPKDPAWKKAKRARLVTAAEPMAPPAEAYRMIAVNVAPHPNGLSRIMVTSPGEGEGKTSTAANLAVSFMEAGYRVALVSVDFRRPRLHAFFNAPHAPGLSEVVTGQANLHDSLIEPTRQLSILPSGSHPKHPHRIVRDAVMNGLFSGMLGPESNGSRPPKRTAAAGNGHRKTGGHHEPEDGPTQEPEERTLVIIDAPAALEGAEASAVAAMVDGVVMVVRAGKTTRGAAARAAEQIRRSGGNLVGTILVGGATAGGSADVGSDR